MVSAAIDTVLISPFSSTSIKTEEKVHHVEKDVCIITGSGLQLFSHLQMTLPCAYENLSLLCRP